MATAIKLLAKMQALPVGHLLEDIVNHALWGHSTFDGVLSDTKEAREFRRLLKSFGYDYDAHAPLSFVEKDHQVPADRAAPSDKGQSQRTGRPHGTADGQGLEGTLRAV